MKDFRIIFVFFNVNVKVRISILISVKKSENIVDYPGFGAVRYVKNPRARNLSVRINQRGEIRVTVPRYASFSRAEAFVRSREGWIRKQQQRMRQRQASFSRMEEGSMLDLKGKRIPLHRKNGKEDLEDALWRILLEEARAYLPGRVEALAHEHGLFYSGLKVRRMRSRWGSCTANNSINLNTWLMIIPEHLSDYVILHELAHTRHKDHSSRFWNTLDELTGGKAMSLRRELRAYQIMGINFTPEL
jgi:predicted metal-dependent hydrolase